MRVLVTRAREGADRLSSRLREAGFEPIECPLVRIEPLRGVRFQTAGYDWLVLTSRVAVREARRCLEGPWPKVAAVGPGTAEALREIGVEPAYVPDVHSQAGLVAGFPSGPGRVLFAGAEGASMALAEALAADFVPLYRTVESPSTSLPAAELAVVASASAARALSAFGEQVPPCVSIGPSTSAAVRQAGLRVVAEARASDLDGLIEAVTMAASRLSHS